jgi:hypothetical protein
MRNTFIERIFGLFTSRDHAEAIAGDLLEERHSRGGMWLWPTVVGVAIVLWRNSVREAPSRVLSLAASGAVMLVGPAFAGVATVGLFPQFFGTPVSWAALSAVWWGGAMWTGASVVNRDPRHGTTACATMASIVAAVSAGLAVSTISRGGTPLFSATAMLAAGPLMLGAAIAHSRFRERALSR